MTAYRMLYLSFAGLMSVGIWLSGLDRVHWLLYVPVAFATFAGLTGFCVNLWFWKMMGFPEQRVCKTGNGQPSS